MTKRKRKSGHGGWREGAGRKPSIGDGAGAEERVTVSIGAEHAHELEQVEREQATSRAGAIRWLIEESARRRARRS